MGCLFWLWEKVYFSLWTPGAINMVNTCVSPFCSSSTIFPKHWMPICAWIHWASLWSILIETHGNRGTFYDNCFSAKVSLFILIYFKIVKSLKPKLTEPAMVAHYIKMSTKFDCFFSLSLSRRRTFRSFSFEISSKKLVLRIWADTLDFITAAQKSDGKQNAPLHASSTYLNTCLCINWCRIHFYCFSCAYFACQKRNKKHIKSNHWRHQWLLLKHRCFKVSEPFSASTCVFTLFDSSICARKHAVNVLAKYKWFRYFYFIFFFFW